MKVLVLYDYPPSPGGIATQGDLLYKGLKELGVDVQPVNFESAQEKEFDKFSGAILVTTNCVTIPKDSYKDRMFTCGIAGVAGVKHIKSRDFSEVISRALSLPPLPENPQGTLSTGFHYTTVLGLAGKIAEEARSTAGNTWKPLQQSRLLYDHIVSSISYDKSGTGWGRGDALYACNIRKGNCTDFHSLFIAQARALGVPARFIMGLPLPENKTEGTIAGYHCWAEFFLSDKGWIPIDASEASKFPEKKEQFFGGLDEHRIAFTLGRDIKLPDSAAEPLNYFIYPYVEIDGLSHKNIQPTLYFKDYPLRNRAIEKLPGSKVSIN